MQIILEHIKARLDGPLDDIWQGPDGHDPAWQPRAGMTPEEISALIVEERWARWCTELLVGTGYGGSEAYGSGKFTDKQFFEAFGRDEPVVSVRMACQQLCTYALLSRGFGLSELTGNGTVGISSGPCAYLVDKCFESWEAKAGDETIGGAQGALARHPGLGPGSVSTFQPPGEGQATGSHAVFVLRTLRQPGAIDGLAVQLLDTGAVRNGGSQTRSPRSNADKPRAARDWVGGNYDNGLFGGKLGVVTGQTAVPFKGVGIAKTRTPSEIQAGIARAQRARPLGILRLVLLSRRETVSASKPVDLSEVAYVSPPLWMHDVTSETNYYISRLLWSLRDLPGFTEWQGVWVLENPVHDLAQAAFKAPRSRALRDLWESTVGIKRPDADCCSAFMLVAATNDGKVRLPWRKKAKTTTIDGHTTVEEVVEPESRTGYEAIVSKLGLGRRLQEKVKDNPSGFTAPPYFAPW
ncbi:MAG: hypothetical protein JNL21_01755 [Myxococcales bacterium]|nr:hypothetical protein [Myxococcales bacterium]